MLLDFPEGIWSITRTFFGCLAGVAVHLMPAAVLFPEPISGPVISDTGFDPDAAFAKERLIVAQGL